MLYVILLNLYTGYMFTPFTTTPQKTNMETKNGGLVQRIFFFQTGDFQLNHVSFEGCIQIIFGPILCVCLL